MDYIKQILSKKDCSYDELISCFEHIKANGDVVIIKFDGERTEDGYTIFITFPEIKNREMIRVDENNLKIGISNILTKYIE